MAVALLLLVFFGDMACSDAIVVIQELLGEAHGLVPVHVEVVSHLVCGAVDALALHYLYFRLPAAGSRQSYVYPARGFAFKCEGTLVHDVRLGQYGSVVLLHHFLQGEVLVQDGISQVLEVLGVDGVADNAHVVGVVGMHLHWGFQIELLVAFHSVS